MQGSRPKLQRTANLNSAEIRLCNLQGEAEQVILDPLMESHGSLFGQALIQRRFDKSSRSVQGECISPNATPDNGGLGSVFPGLPPSPGAAASAGGIYPSSRRYLYCVHSYTNNINNLITNNNLTCITLPRRQGVFDSRKMTRCSRTDTVLRKLMSEVRCGSLINIRTGPSVSENTKSNSVSDTDSDNYKGYLQKINDRV